MTDVAASITQHIESFAHALVVSLLNLELHAVDSDEVQETLRQLDEDLHHLTASGIDPVRVSFEGDSVYVDQRLAVGASLQARRLLDLVSERGLAELQFGAAANANELLRLLLLLTSSRKIDAFEEETIERAMRSHGISNVKAVLRVRRAAAAGDPHATTPAETQPAAVRGYQELADCLQNSHVAASRGETIALDRAAGVVEQAMAEMDREPSGLLSLAYYDDIDSFTVGHSVRVALLTLQVARAAGADTATMLRAGTAALLHDIGKSRIPQSVLFKRGPLDDDEWAIMGLHPQLGAEILVEQPDIDPTAIGAAFCHHMAPGNKGYPTPTLPFEPSGISKLVRVVDVFEALTSVRPYKPAMSPVEAYVIMHRTPGDFDAAWLRFFVDVIGLYPLGTRLRLSTGEHAMVIGHGPRRDRPRVRVSHDADGNPRPDGAPTLITIGEEVDGVVCDIDSVVASLRAHTEIEVDPHDASGHTPCC